MMTILTDIINNHNFSKQEKKRRVGLVILKSGVLPTYEQRVRLDMGEAEIDMLYRMHIAYRRIIEAQQKALPKKGNARTPKAKKKKRH